MATNILYPAYYNDGYTQRIRVNPKDLARWYSVNFDNCLVADTRMSLAEAKLWYPVFHGPLKFYPALSDETKYPNPPDWDDNTDTREICIWG